MSQPKQSRAERRAQFKRTVAKELRENATEAEKTLWRFLRGKRMAHLRFRRQQTIGPYIVDFFCSAAKLVIELDGSQHGTDENIACDLARTKWLEARGYRVLRFWNVDFLKEKEAVLEGIWRAIHESGVPLPEPPSAVRPSLKGRVEK
jgi:very-short-patch-repair endonuclease